MDKAEAREGQRTWQNEILSLQLSRPVLSPVSPSIRRSSEDCGGHGGRREHWQRMCLDTHLWGCKAFGKGEERVKLPASLPRCLPLLRRAKYFHGKKVNGEIEIRVEQVGWRGSFSAITLTLEPFPGATLIPNLIQL